MFASSFLNMFVCLKKEYYNFTVLSQKKSSLIIGLIWLILCIKVPTQWYLKKWKLVIHWVPWAIPRSVNKLQYNQNYFNCLNSDVDACASGYHDCDDMECVNNKSSYYCQCGEGYKTVGDACEGTLIVYHG